jgi:hypothetical protein
MRYPKRHSLLFRLACEGLRLTLLLFAAFIAACLLLAPFGGIAWSEELFQTALPFFTRLAVSLFSVFAIAIVYESLT